MVKSRLVGTVGILSIVGTVLGVATAGVFAQAPTKLEFDVASVKPHMRSILGTSMVVQPGGRFVAVNIPARMLIRTAFQLQEQQIVGGPDWLDSEGFDIDAKMDTPDPSPLLVVSRLQALLVKRFTLQTHHETKELPVYAIVRIRPDTLGPKMHDTQCPPLEVDLASSRPCANISWKVGGLTLRGMPVTQFLDFLAPRASRIVVDRTALGGRYDIDLTWDPNLSGPADTDAVSIFTAIQEQLGLRLEPTRASVDVLVIDHVEHPTED